MWCWIFKWMNFRPCSAPSCGIYKKLHRYFFYFFGLVSLVLIIDPKNQQFCAKPSRVISMFQKGVQCLIKHDDVYLTTSFSICYFYCTQCLIAPKSLSQLLVNYRRSSANIIFSEATTGIVQCPPFRQSSDNAGLIKVHSSY